MEKSLFEQNSDTYSHQGDCFLLYVKLLDPPIFEIDAWSNRRRPYLKRYRSVKYYSMLTQYKIKFLIV